jgi:hypothetical protein
VRTQSLFTKVAALLCFAGIGLMAACSDSGSGSLTGVDDTDASAALDASASATSLDAASTGVTLDRLETNLRPGEATHSTGQLTKRDNGRFETEITIAKADFDVMDITPGNGFDDEVVRLVVTRAGSQIFSTRVPFADRNPGSVDFKKTFSAPLHAGDVVKAIVNGHLALRGTLRND